MYLVMDVGGTRIKYGVAGDDGVLLSDTCSQVDSPSDGSREAVFEAFASVIARGAAAGELKEACVCMPGPFDYVNGVSHMKHKFASIEGASLKPVFASAGLNVTFVHDSTAFILGEWADGPLREAQSPCCIMLGTGLGYAMMRHGRVCERPDHSPAFTLWNMPYLDGTGEDAVSTRAIQAYYGARVPVVQIAQEARNGNGKAAEAFLRAGRHLSALLRLVAERFHPDLCALGGQISASADLFRIDSPIPLYTVSNPERTALRGAAVYAHLGREKTVTTEFV